MHKIRDNSCFVLINFSCFVIICSQQLIFIDSKNKALYLTTNEGSSYTKIPLTVAVPDRLLFHPIQEDWILSYSEADRTVRSLGFAFVWIHYE